MKPIIIDTTNPSRSKMLKIFEQINKDLLSKIRADRNYRMPPGYIDWHTISAIGGLCLQTCGEESAKLDISAFIHSYRFSLWFCHDAPIYCLTPEIIEAFDRTDALHKPGILAGWKPSLPFFLLAIPKGLIHAPDGGEVDYLLISAVNPDHPEWQSGKWKHGKVKEVKSIAFPGLFFQITTTDSRETVWTSGTGIAADSTLIYSEDADFGRDKLSSADRLFIKRIRNLTINVLLALEFSPSLIDGVNESETKSKSKTKGFAIDRPTTNTRYPRWLGKNYQSKSETPDTCSTHSPPRSHWRKGHWRVLESGEGKRWREAKRIWIEPVLVNS